MATYKLTKRCVLCQRSRNLRSHEFPSNALLREKWLAVVPDDEIPKFPDNPKICELHFKPEDYVPDLKKRILKKGVVPVLAPLREDPNDLKRLDRKKRTLKKGVEPVLAPLREDPNDLNGLDTQVVLMDNSEISVETTEITEDLPAGLQIVKSQVQPKVRLKKVKEISKAERKIEILRAQIRHLREENTKKARHLKSISSELKELKTVSHRQASELKTKDKILCQMEVKVRRFEKLISKKDLGTAIVKEKIEKEKEEQLKKISNLKEQVEMLSTERKEMEQICYYKNIEEMILNMDTDRKAAFILDQIRLYKMKLPRYAESTLQECIIWEDTDPRGYQFVRESELLTLPTQHTMKKHLGPMDLEINMENSCNTQTNV